MAIRHRQLNQYLGIIILSSSLAVIGVLGGVVPEFSRSPWGISFSYAASAEDITNEDVQKYAQAVLNMESLRQQAYTDIRQIIGKQPPNLVCNQPQSFNSLSRDAREIAVNYCQASKKIVENSGLSVSKFNRITTNVQSNPNLERRIQNAMIQIRRRS